MCIFLPNLIIVIVSLVQKFDKHLHLKNELQFSTLGKIVKKSTHSAFLYFLYDLAFILYDKWGRATVNSINATEKHSLLVYGVENPKFLAKMEPYPNRDPQEGTNQKGGL